MRQTKIILTFLVVFFSTYALAVSTWPSGIFTQNLSVGNPSTPTKNVVMPGGGGVQFSNLTNSERDSLTAVVGQVIFNTTTDLLNYYDGTRWNNISNTSYISSDQIRNMGIAAGVGSNNLTISLITERNGIAPATTDTVSLAFRSAVATTGNYQIRTIGSARLLTVFNGSTLGCTNSVACQLYVYLVDTDGTNAGVTVGVSGTLFDDGSLTNVVYEGSGTATSANVLYSTLSASSKPIRNIGKITITEASAGVWVTAPTQLTLAPLFTNAFTHGSQTFLSNGSFVVPSGVNNVTIIGAGGGGGGGAGAAYDASGTGGGAGSGGAGAQPKTVIVGVTPLSTLTVTIGAGGAGGPTPLVNNSGSNGSSGASTTVVGTGVSLTFLGAGGGNGGTRGVGGGGGGSAISSAWLPIREMVGSGAGGGGGVGGASAGSNGGTGVADNYAAAATAGNTGPGNGSGGGGGSGGSGYSSGGTGGQGDTSGGTPHLTAGSVGGTSAGGGGGGGNSDNPTGVQTGAAGGAGGDGIVIISY